MGPRDGPLVLLLHGFPECWVSWRKQLPALAVAGFRAVAPDLRGYGASDKPPRVRDYQMEALVGDVANLISALGRERADLIGHDWGGYIAWHFAMQHPRRIRAGYRMRASSASRTPAISSTRTRPSGSTNCSCDFFPDGDRTGMARKLSRKGRRTAPRRRGSALRRKLPEYEAKRDFAVTP